MAEAQPLPVEPTTTTPAATLPKLTAKDFRVYNHMAEHMDQFHNHFRATWNTLYRACETSQRPSGMTLRAFLAMAEQFCTHLTLHHTIEEQHIFPVLARKMPAFRAELEMLTHHKAIHAGVDRLEGYVGAVRQGEREFRFGELKEVMDSFGATLWEHLDAEVKQLGAENMRLFWSMDEMRKMPM